MALHLWLILIHPTLGVLGALAALWLLMELYHASAENLDRIKWATWAVTILVWLSYIIAAWLYIYYYGPDKQVIKGGEWWWAHSFFTETKEHVFFIGILIASMLPYTLKLDVVNDKNARKYVIMLVWLVIIGGLLMEGAGAIMSMGYRVGVGA